MIYIVIGQSGAGKTTFAKERLLPGEPQRIVDSAIPYTLYSKKTIALGRYGIDKRTEGTDTLSYSAQAGIKAVLNELTTAGYDVVMEGDRITNKNIFRYVKALDADVKLYLVGCSVATSIRRLRAAGSTITPAFVRATKTKSKRLFLEYARHFAGEYISTEGGGK